MNKLLLATLTLLSLLLLTHDLVPLGRWNNLAAHPHRESLFPRLIATVINSLVGLVPTFLAWRTLHDHGLTSGRRSILIFLSILLAGELLSWWIAWITGRFPLTSANPARLAALTAGTYTFIPERHGVQPTLLRCLLHLLTFPAFLELLLVLRT